MVICQKKENGISQKHIIFGHIYPGIGKCPIHIIFCHLIVAIIDHIPNGWVMFNGNI